MNIYVGNLSYEAENEDLMKAFEPYGKVVKATVIKDKFSGRSRGFGFVEMSTETETKAAIEGMSGKELKGRQLKVNEALPRPERNSGGSDR